MSDELYETVVQGMFAATMERITREYADDPWILYADLEEVLASTFEACSKRLATVAQNQREGVKARAAAFALAWAARLVRDSSEWRDNLADTLELRSRFAPSSEPRPTAEGAR
jgi:hypothetical protein